MADVLVAFVGMRPTRPACSVKYNALSEPAVMPVGTLPAVGRAISEMSDPLVAVTGMWPILLPPCSVNHIWPSGPLVMPNG